MKRLKITGVDRTLILERIDYLTRMIHANPTSPGASWDDMELMDLQESLSRPAALPRRPDGPVRVLREISFECDADGAFFTFEKSVREVALVEHKGRQYVRLIEYACTAEANARPCARLEEFYYLVFRPAAAGINRENWTSLVILPPVYHHQSYGNDVLY